MNPLALVGAIAVLIIASTNLAIDAQALEYPSRPIRLIVPFGAGGTSDIVARLVGASLSEDLGNPVVIDNRPGAGAVIGTQLITLATPDGYTIMLAHMGLAINETMHPKRGYNATRDLTAVSLIGITPSVLVVNNKLPAKNVKEFIALAKAQASELAYGSAGIGSQSHLAVELLQHRAKVRFNHVAYRGSGQALIDLIAGQIQFAIPTVPVAMAHARAGRLRVIATTGEKRSAAMPDVPTIIEGGLGGYSFTPWYGIFVPAGTPKSVISRLNQAIVRALRNADLREKLASQGMEPESSTAEHLNNLLRREIGKWAEIIEAAGIIPR